MNAAYSAFRRVSAELGANPRHVQGPGGNTSFKLGAERMLVKGSGFELARAEVDEMFVDVNAGKIRAALRDGNDDPLAGAWPGVGPKPSIETSMHALLPSRVVLHTHSLPVVIAACRTNAREHLAARLAGLDWVFVEYERPGTPLARGIARALAGSPGASVVVLQNHGVVVGADEAEPACALLEDVCRRLDVTARPVSGAPDRDALAVAAERSGLALPADETLHRLALDAEAARIATGGTLYPDHVVFLGSGVGLLAGRPPGPPAGPASPKLWIAPGQGVLLERGLPKASEALARCLMEVALGLPSRDACRYLSPSDEAAVLGMEEEKYRQSLARRVSD
jgi:rhamnose utilization protein RhaD (predicted bifunctional aldolase and dehydrogenase)